MIRNILIVLIHSFTCKAIMKGVWLPISGTVAPQSEAGIIDAVNRCSSIGINTIYFAVWNHLMINFSPINQSLFEEYPFVKINPKYEFNPLQILIRQSHKRGIKVIGWFEYGFATSFNDPTGGIIFKYKPQWKAIDHQGKLVTKNNFQWMNPFSPPVQQFMLDLVGALLASYPQIDGVQGDDRMPAVPSISGYDDYTIKLYKESHDGKNPPANHLDPSWIQWRCNILNAFMKRLSEFVRSKKNNYELHMSPTTFPFSKEEYLQDWPVWVENGWTDIILPQVYRTQITQYRISLLNNLELVPKNKKDQFYPGILVGLGSDPTKNGKILQHSIELNRELNLKGQSYFYYESLKDSRIASIIMRH